MDMPMKDGMEKKDPMFKCPACGEMLSVESKGESDMEHKAMKKPMHKDNAASMPMDSLKNKISSGPTMNMNSY